MSSRPLSEGNALQRRYAAWAAGHYARMPEPVRSEAQRIDRWLYSRSGLVFWLGLLSALAASAVGLAAAGLPVWLAVLASPFVWGALALGLLGAWMAPDRFEARRLARGPEDAPFLEELQALQNKNPHYRFEGIMTEPVKSSRPWAGETGRLNAALLSKYLLNIEKPIYYVVGPPGMVVALRTMLKDARIKDSDIRTEQFAGY